MALNLAWYQVTVNGKVIEQHLIMSVAICLAKNTYGGEWSSMPKKYEPMNIIEIKR